MLSVLFSIILISSAVYYLFFQQPSAKKPPSTLPPPPQPLPQITVTKPKEIPTRTTTVLTQPYKGKLSWLYRPE